MGERKVLVRYVPPDFDPSIIPKFKREKNRICEVRTMIPFSIRCSTCGEYMGRGKKFNSKKEMCEGDTYMGIRKFRFIIKCAVCSAQIAFKTDPKNSDYEMEYGATRNFEVWKDNEAALEEDQKLQEEEEKMDAMKSLENRTLDSKTEMDILDALDETMAINKRHQRIDTDAILAKRYAQTVAEQTALTNEDENLLEEFRSSRKRKQEVDNIKEKDTSYLNRDVYDAMTIPERITQQTKTNNLHDVKDNRSSGISTKIIPKKRKITDSATEKSSEQNQLCNSSKTKKETSDPLVDPSGLFAAYGSSSDDDI